MQSRVVGAVLTCDTSESSDYRYCRVGLTYFVTLVSSSIEFGSSFGFNFQLLPLPRGLDFMLLQRVFPDLCKISWAPVETTWCVGFGGAGEAMRRAQQALPLAAAAIHQDDGRNRCRDY